MSTKRIIRKIGITQELELVINKFRINLKNKYKKQRDGPYKNTI